MRVENIVAKDEIDHTEKLLPLSQCFESRLLHMRQNASGKELTITEIWPSVLVSPYKNANLYILVSKWVNHGILV